MSTYPTLKGRKRKRPTTRDDISAAYHEAAHCVALVHLNRRIILATINGIGEARAAVHFDAPNEPSEQDHADNIMMSVCGTIAEQYSGFTTQYGNASDMRRILASSRRTEFPLTAIKRAEELLTHEWMAVEVVASALLEHGWLNGYEVKRLVEGTHTP
jgi:hypothetical protein